MSGAFFFIALERTNDHPFLDWPISWQPDVERLTLPVRDAQPKNFDLKYVLMMPKVFPMQHLRLISVAAVALILPYHASSMLWHLPNTGE